MEITPGYKISDVGLIPQDWNEQTLGSLGSVIRGASPRPKGDKRYYGGDIPRLMVEDVTRDKKFVTPQIDYLTAEGAKRSRPCKKGSLTIVCSGTPGVVGLPSFLAVDACIHDGMLALVNLPSKIVPDYLYHQIRGYQAKLYNAATHGGTFVNLTTAGLRAFNIALPPTDVEQHAIATALSDVDALVDGLTRLIAKKRNLKQATMQQLMTGNTRLPGFSGEWQAKRLGDTAVLKARIGWQGLTTAEYLAAGDIYLVTGTEFKDGYIDWKNCYYVDEYRYKQDKYIQLRPRDILVTKDGTIGKVAFVPYLPGPATLNSGVFVIRPIAEAFNPEFFYYLLCSRVFSDFLEQLCAGSTISHLYQKDFVSFIYRTPPTLEEQAAIAVVLSDMDAELTGLGDRLAKIRALKQAMMQELLTGKTRLLTAEAPHA